MNKHSITFSLDITLLSLAMVFCGPWLSSIMLWKGKYILYTIKTYLTHSLHFAYLVEAFLLGGWTLHTTYDLTWVQEGVLFETLVYIVYIRERYYFSLVCTFKKAIKNVEVKVDVQKGPLGFRRKAENTFVSFIQFTFQPLLSYGNSPQWLPFLVFLGFAFGS